MASDIAVSGYDLKDDQMAIETKQNDSLSTEPIVDEYIESRQQNKIKGKKLPRE